MAEYDHDDPMHVQHFVKVHDFAATIGTLENLDEQTLFILEAAAIVHDIGIRISDIKYGDHDGKYQELEGPGEARELLHKVGGFTEEQIERVCYLVGHHHTYDNIVEIDYQILIEADFLVNIFENNLHVSEAKEIRKTIFKTESGKRLFDAMYTNEPQPLPGMFFA